METGAEHTMPIRTHGIEPRTNSPSMPSTWKNNCKYGLFQV